MKETVLSNHHQKHYANSTIWLLAILVTVISIFLSTTTLSSITSMLPMSFLLLFAIQRNKRLLLQQLFSIKEWKRPLCHILLCIVVACYCILTSQNTEIYSRYISQIMILLPFLFVQSFNEEYVYRYFLLTKLNHRIIYRIMFSSALFTAFHYVLPGSFTSITIFFWATMAHRFLLGILFSLFYIRHHSIYEVTILHFLYDIVAILAPEDSYLFTAFLCALIVFEKRAAIQLLIRNIKEASS